MPEAQTKQKFYKPDELVGALYRLMVSREILPYVKDHPWSDYVTISRGVRKKKRNVSFGLISLESYGFVKSDLRLVRKATPKKRGLAMRCYALSDNYEDKVKEIAEAIKTSEYKYYRRRAEKHPIPTTKQMVKLLKEFEKHVKLNLPTKQ